MTDVTRTVVPAEEASTGRTVLERNTVYALAGNRVDPDIVQCAAVTTAVADTSVPPQ